jgi:3-hydroxyacyl-CoA dehydrogenase
MMQPITVVIAGLLGSAVAVAITIAVSVTVDIEPPPSAGQIGDAVVQSYAEQIEASRQSAQARKDAMRCGLPGYEACR